MTAEIVIMNKHGLSLAADSAITSGQEGVRKVYNSANKLFALSEQHPVGLMVYGSASFMEIPWDIILKTFSNELGNKKFKYLSDYMDHFLDFLQKEKRFYHEEVEEIIVYRTFTTIIKEIVKEVESTIEEDADAKMEQEYVTNCLIKCVKKNISYYKKKDVYLQMNYDSFLMKFNSTVEEICKEVIPHETPEELMENLYRLAYEVVKRDFFSVGSSGFVITGYGEKEIFPRLLNYRLEGFVFEQLKYKKLKEKRISYTYDQYDGTASISAFGQSEMVDSFIEGIEPDMEEAMFGILDKVLKSYYDQMQQLLNITLTKDQVQKLEKMGNTIYESISDAVEEYKENNYLQPLLGVVRSLPVRELAEMTETLINLTSFKRRVTRVTESVGPPIDVAVITKGDGFVWVRRKQVVDPK
ncbi:hypothetical protein SPD48_07925 [Pseudogracilibacillus sp. SE30717A]|uniref:hypothetical protein n=1 Tax=Pseudogracilibacillus sp. SE30717A TaxID=3098293 RepID=UPI00300DFF84